VSENGRAPDHAAERAAARVTVVIPTYNHSHYLKDCLGSLREQTDPRWRAIIVDDYSSDYKAIAPILERLGDERVSVLRHERNRGLGASRNTGIRASETPYVLPLDADDKLAPRAIELLSGALDADPRVDCAYPDVLMFGRQEGVLVFPGPGPGKQVTGPETTIPGAGTMMRRTLWERMGGYDEAEALRHGREDLEFWIRAFSQGCRSVRVPEQLYLYRHAHTSMNMACRYEDHQVNQYIHDKHRTAFESPEHARLFLAAGYWSASEASYQRGQQGRALRMASKALQIHPSRTSLRTLGRALIPPRALQARRRGELRRRLPFLGFPLRGAERHRPFFVIGVARSGNTLFRRILTSHSALHVPPETFVLGECIEKFRRYSRRLSWPDLVQLMLAQFELHHEYHTIDVWLGPLATRLVNTPYHRRNLATILDGFYRFHAEQQGKNPVRWGDKTPLNSLYRSTLDGLAEVFPDAQFLHIYRDPPDVIHSHLAGGFMRTVEDASQRWLTMMRNCRSFVAAHPGMCHEVKYERLVSDPEATTREVCEFLGIEYEPRMIASEQQAAELGDVPAWWWHDNVTQPISTVSVGKGRRFFSRSERETMHAIIGREMSALDYPPIDVTTGGEE